MFLWDYLVHLVPFAQATRDTSMPYLVDVRALIDWWEAYTIVKAAQARKD